MSDRMRGLIPTTPRSQIPPSLPFFSLLTEPHWATISWSETSGLQSTHTPSSKA